MTLLLVLAYFIVGLVTLLVSARIGGFSADDDMAAGVMGISLLLFWPLPVGFAALVHAVSGFGRLIKRVQR